VHGSVNDSVTGSISGSIRFSRSNCFAMALGSSLNFPDTIDDLGMSSGLISCEGLEC
jgi:hypothetical protein